MTQSVRRPQRMVWVFVAAFLALAVVGLTTVALGYHLRTEAVLHQWADEELDDGQEAVRQLGGSERAAGRLGFYLRIPGRPADCRVAALELLGFCGRPAVPRLIEILDEENDDEVGTWSLVLEALGRIGPDAAPAVPSIIPFIETIRLREADYRSHAAMTLGQIGPAAKAAIPALRAKLAPASPRIWDQAEISTDARAEEAVALWRITGDPRQAVPELAKTCEFCPYAEVPSCGPPAQGSIGDRFSKESNPLALESLYQLRTEIRAAGVGLLGRTMHDGTFRVMGWYLPRPFHELKPGAPGEPPTRVQRDSLTRDDFTGPIDFDPTAFHAEAPKIEQ